MVNFYASMACVVAFCLALSSPAGLVASFCSVWIGLSSYSTISSHTHPWAVMSSTSSWTLTATAARQVQQYKANSQPWPAMASQQGLSSQFQLGLQPGLDTGPGQSSCIQPLQTKHKSSHIQPPADMLNLQNQPCQPACSAIILLCPPICAHVMSYT